jgi:hypothetical protein
MLPGLNPRNKPQHFPQNESCCPDKNAIPAQALIALRSIKGRNSGRMAFSVTKSTGWPSSSSSKNCTPKYFSDVAGASKATMMSISLDSLASSRTVEPNNAKRVIPKRLINSGLSLARISSVCWRFIKRKNSSYANIQNMLGFLTSAQPIELGLSLIFIAAIASLRNCYCQMPIHYKNFLFFQVKGMAFYLAQKAYAQEKHIFRLKACTSNTYPLGLCNNN